jgi:photosystem II stability/assembly factor-like uncharacterized protein
VIGAILGGSRAVCPLTAFAGTNPVVARETARDTIVPIDLSFIDQKRGWLLLQRCGNEQSEQDCHSEVRATTDGGRTWIRSGVLPVPRGYWLSDQHPDGENRTVTGVAGIRFTDARHGWAFGPSFYATRDGGATWSSQQVDGEVVEFEPVGDSLWAILRSCPQYAGRHYPRFDGGDPDHLPECRFSFVRSEDGGKTWTSQPNVRGGIVRADRLNGWMYMLSGDHEVLVATKDEGKHWRAGPDPCAGASPALVSAADSKHLWALCCPECDDGGELLFRRSSDGGATWSGAAVAYFAKFCCVTLTATSTKSAWRSGPGGLMGTRDGGCTWTEASIPEDPIFEFDPSSSHFGRIVFLNRLFGWATYGGYDEKAAVLRTADGGRTWQLIRLQP